MATTSEARALPFFTDLIGQPLSSGFIYIGQAGLDPLAYPAVIHSDIAGTVVVAQPVRTTNGHAAAAGALIHLFVPVPYSITILDSAGRLVYTSLNETDPVALAVGLSSVQSAANLAALRARVGSSTNQVWVSGIGMYVFNPADSTSPENVPLLIVGNDGSRYSLSVESAPWLTALAPAAPASKGLYLSWNDGGDGAAFITTNEGTGTGGTIIRTVNSAGTTELGRVTIAANGAITAGGNINTAGSMTAGTSLIASGNVQAGGNLVSTAGGVTLNAANTRGLSYSSAPDQYNFASAPLIINGSVAMTMASIVANLSANGVGSYGLGNTTSTQPVLPGTWLQTGTAQAGVVLWLRTA